MLGWLRRLTGTGPVPSASIPPHSSTHLPGADPFPDIPVEIGRREVIPGHLDVAVFAYARPSYGGPVDIWMMLTDGLWKEGHPEILLCLKRRGEARDGWPSAMLQLLAAVYKAAKGRTGPLTAGEVLSIEGGGALGLFGAAEFGALALTHAEVPRGMRATAPWVQAVPLTRAEEFMATRYGAVRVLSALGWTVREFPTLPWHDGTRAEAGIPPGLLEPISRGRWIGIKGYLVPREPLPWEEIDAHRCELPYDLSGGRWLARLEIPRSQAAELHRFLDEMGMSWTFALLLDPDPDARAVLRRTDKPGAPAIMLGQGPLAGSVRIALNQVAFFCTDSGDSSNLVEDGLALFLSKPSMTALHAALRATEPFLLSQPQYDLEVCWTESSYSNPFNDEVLTRPYQYHVQAVSAAMSHCALVTVTVLGSREEFASKVHFDAITSLSFATARTVNRWAETLPQASEGAVLIVEQVVSEAGRRFRIAYQPPDLDSFLGPLMDELTALPALHAVHSGEVTMHLTFQVRTKVDSPD